LPGHTKPGEEAIQVNLGWLIDPFSVKFQNNVNTQF
jgi:hypothetical protein